MLIFLRIENYIINRSNLRENTDFDLDIKQKI